ncbi:MAG: glycosyl transferase family 2 [Cytophagaceae bacterium]|nr:glycosyl transferase family 2 [Cytophagaceae bacterium]
MSQTKICLIVCTYQRPVAMLALLQSVSQQSVLPSQILVIDGSLDTATQECLDTKVLLPIDYHLVAKEHRGLTRQRNYGISLVAPEIDIVCFLDDDVILETNYFEAIAHTFNQYPEAKGVGGFITNEVVWEPATQEHHNTNAYYCYDGFARKEGVRYRLRAKLGLLDQTPPGIMPPASHGRPVGYLPPTGKTYPAQLLMGCSMSFRKEVFEHCCFSTYFEGYGLYEDADFCLRVDRLGPQFVNTQARLAHYHEPSGRPNHYKYGKMVLRNGWYVWRVKYPKPSIAQRLKWNATALVLTLIRYSNALTSQDKKAALKEGLGRTIGWGSLIFNRPKLH